MTKVSRIFVDPERMGFFYNSFWSVVTLLENKEQVKSFLKDILTPTEMKMISKRLQIARMLIEGKTYDHISSQVKVTHTTIGKISNILSSGGEGLYLAVAQLQKIEKELEKQRMNSTVDLKKK